MKLKLKESIRANGVQYLPPAVIDTDEIGITEADAAVLVRRGTAETMVEEAMGETDEQRAEREAANAAEIARLEAEAIAEQARLDAAAAEAVAKAEAEAKAKAEAKAAAKATKKK